MHNVSLEVKVEADPDQPQQSLEKQNESENLNKKFILEKEDLENVS